MNVHTKEYPQDTIQFQHNGFQFTFDPADNKSCYLTPRLAGKGSSLRKQGSMGL